MTADSEPRTLRLFVAVELPPAWLDALATAQTTLRRHVETAAAPRLRWVRPEGTHLTFKFLGNVEEDRLPSLEATLAAAVPAPPGFTLSLGVLGAFSSGRRLRVIWAGLGGDLEPLAFLAGRIDAACAGLAFQPERRPFAPHLTLARVPDGASLSFDALVPLIESVRLAAPPFAVERVSLMRSHLGPGGSRYERLAIWPG